MHMELFMPFLHIQCTVIHIVFHLILHSVLLSLICMKSLALFLIYTYEIESKKFQFVLQCNT